MHSECVPLFPAREVTDLIDCSCRSIVNSLPGPS